jgi:cell division protein FtsA
MDIRSVPEDDLIFAMDIGTRSIIGMVGVMEGDKLRIVAIEKEAHTRRAMLDGQIEDIAQVAAVGRVVKERLEARLDRKLKKVCIAAAGRALKTQRASYELQFPEPTRLDNEAIGRLESGALTKAEAEFRRGLDGKTDAKFYLVGHTVVEYQVDGYPMSNLLDHKGKRIQAEVVATFLPGEVVDSLYTTMHLLNLDVISMTLEPIAAINAVIPANLRLLNLALVDIGAGTSDIAVSRDGGVVGYTMATVAGDEITEALMKAYLLDFETAEQVKVAIGGGGEIRFTDILGIEQTVSADEAEKVIAPARNQLCKEIAQRIVEVNGGKAPSAVFLAGGGSKLHGIREAVTEYLGMELNRVAIAGQNFENSAVSDEYILNDSEYATPLGIAISAGFNLITDSFRVTLNGKPAQLFRNGALSVQDLLVMNGSSIQDFLPRNGKNLVVQVNGKREIFRGETGKPAVLLLNGEKARLSNIVHAGDVIEFTPAVKGEDAHVTVGDALGSTALMATVNDEAVSPDRVIADGDVICSEPEEEPAAAFAPPADDDDDAYGAAGTEGPDEVYALPTLTLVGGDAAEPPEGEDSRNSSSRSGIGIVFNGESRVFPPKTDGEPYYLMNLLKYAGFSLEHPDGEVVLQINGKSGSFLDVVNPGDRVDIFCRRRASL